MSKKDDALKLALEALEDTLSGDLTPYQAAKTITVIREALADSALERMAENARELGLDYEPPCKTGSQCTSKCQQCEQPAQQQDMPKIGCVNHDCDKCKAQQQEPVAVARVDDLERGGRVRALAMGLGLDAALYTSPQPAQPSKPLTDEQREGITAMWSRGHRNYTVGDIIDAVEAAHGIKGEA